MQFEDGGYKLSSCQGYEGAYDDPLAFRVNLKKQLLVMAVVMNMQCESQCRCSV